MLVCHWSSCLLLILKNLKDLLNNIDSPTSTHGKVKLCKQCFANKSDKKLNISRTLSLGYLVIFCETNFVPMINIYSAFAVCRYADDEPYKQCFFYFFSLCR